MDWLVKQLTLEMHILEDLTVNTQQSETTDNWSSRPSCNVAGMDYTMKGSHRVIYKTYCSETGGRHCLVCYSIRAG